MKRVKLTLAYDGTNYCGWQWQPNGLTIEQVLNETLSALLKEDIHVIGASRTDSGVHAWANICVFDTEARIPAEKIALALNQKLPPDIAAQKTEEVPLDWHPRKRNSIKTYEYRILNRTMPFPAERLTSYFVYYPLDVEKMKKAAQCLIGEHDFVSFCSVNTSAEETIRSIYEASVTKEGDIITIRLSGSGFLTHMVRIIAGTLVKIGLGIFPPEKLLEMMKARTRYASGPKAPACGLTLISIEEVFGLEPVDIVTNDEWDYSVYQDRIASDGKAFIQIRRCFPQDFERHVIRLVKHAYQNQAKEVFVCGPASCRTAEEMAAEMAEEKAGASAFADIPRLQAGDRYGDYEIRTADDGEVYPCEGRWYQAVDLIREARQQ